MIKFFSASNELEPAIVLAAVVSGTTVLKSGAVDLVGAGAVVFYGKLSAPAGAILKAEGCLSTADPNVDSNWSVLYTGEEIAGNEVKVTLIAGENVFEVDLASPMDFRWVRLVVDRTAGATAVNDIWAFRYDLNARRGAVANFRSALFQSPFRS